MHGLVTTWYYVHVHTLLCMKYNGKSIHLLNPLSTRPHPNVVWYNHSWLGFLKILNYVPQEREKISAKIEPSFVTVKCCDGSCRNYFRQNNLQILKLATYTKIEDHYSRCKLAFSLDWKGLPNVHIWFFYPKVLLICNENKEFLLPIWWYM